MELTDRITQLLEEKFQTDEAFADCFCVEIELKPGNQLHVFADSDSGLTLEKCQKLSRYLESHLDENGWLGEAYLLEVSSPGIDRPLKFPRQYAKNIGRLLSVHRNDDDNSITATLKAADEEKITLSENVTEKEGKKKIHKEVETLIPYSQIKKAIVKLPF